MKKIFLSYSYEDKHFADLLRAQLSATSDIQINFPLDFSPSAEAIERRISKEIQSSSLVIWLITYRFSKWQKFELRKAIDLKTPILGIDTAQVSPREHVPLAQELNIPVVSWKSDNIIKILEGSERTLSYELENKELPKSPIITVDFENISKELTEYLIQNPSHFLKLSPRKYEELIAYLLEKTGYEVTLTKKTRDDGIDIFALKKDQLGSFLSVVDCKRYSPQRPVGIGIVRAMYGVLNIENASHAMVATTSTFTKGARSFESKYKYQISLKDHADIIDWMKQVTS